MHKQEKRKKLASRAGRALAFLCFLFLCFSTNVLAVTNVSLVLSSDADPYKQAAEALQSSLSGKSIHTSVHLLETFSETSSPALAVAKIAQVWVAIGSRAASHLNTILPETTSLVYCMVADPEKIGLDPGRRNVAGVALTKPLREQFAMIRMALPKLHSIGLLYRSSSVKSLQTLADVKKKLPPTWRLEAVDVDTIDSMAGAIQELFSHDIGMVWTMADAAIYNRATVKSLLLASLRNKIPVFGFSGSFVKAGALLGLEADPTLQGQYAASLVLDDLGVNSQDTRVLSAGVTLAVNMVVADRLKISLPDELLQHASVIGAP